MRKPAALTGLLILALSALAARQAKVARPTARSAGWAAYGGDPGGSRYSPLTEINRGNVTRLRVAWTYRTGALQPESPSNRKAAFEATPILAEGALYFSTPFNHVIALDPETGRELWTYDPKVDRNQSYSEVTSRGVSSWLDSNRKADEPCRHRIFTGTIDARLIALDGKTGRPCEDFGTGGVVDLTRDVNLKDRGDYQVTSPPAVIGGLVITGSSMGDNRAADVERGVVRAFDARSGALRWSWDPIPRDPARNTWEGDSAGRTGGANAWSVISADPERGLVFVPTSSPSPDFYGGERRGSNVYANSVVALRAATGKVAWHFQVVHHDLWDYDVAAQPALITVQRNGRAVPAVAVATKIGHLFVLDRETGRPLFPVTERPAPRSTVKGEEAWPTQPFPALPPPIAPQKLAADDAWGATPADRDWCRQRIASLRSEGLFTPPSLEGTVVFPGNAGGAHWGGMAWDPVRGLAIVNTNRLATMVRLIPRDELPRVRAAADNNRMRGEFGRQAGTPYAMYREILLAPSGIPCNPPPWGALAAFDLNSGARRWEVPLGAVAKFGPVSELALGSPNFGGAIVTGGGLVFIAAAMDTYLRAFDVDNGKEFWKAELPASAQATPMTFRLRDGGRQFVVIAAGGHAKLGTKMGDAVVAFALQE